MNILVTYKSKTGFSKRYAEIIAQRLGCAYMNIEDVTQEVLDGIDIIIFGGGLYAGRINGFMQAKEKYEKSAAQELVLFATGGTPNATKEAIEEMWKNNLSQEELEGIKHFYMQSGICYEKMQLSDKVLMKMASAMLRRKKDKSEFDEGFERAISHSYDILSEEYATPLIDYVSRGA